MLQETSTETAHPARHLRRNSARSGRLAAPATAMLLFWVASCAPPAGGSPRPVQDAGADGAVQADADLPFEGGTGDGCICTPGSHNELIYVLSDNAELWTYDPKTNAFGFVTGLNCGALNSAFSMAVDPAGRSWILSIGDERIYTIDVNQPMGCMDSGYAPGQPGFGLFGMAFATNSKTDPCARLHVLTYSGAGPFGEGPNAGALGVMDPKSFLIEKIADINYDGGELSGTGDGRLFAFAGQNPAKLIEYDKSTAAVIQLVPLDGFHKTNASALAFYGGDTYFFTEAPPAGCSACLGSACAQPESDCLSQPDCAKELACALAAGDITDACGGGMPSDLQACLFGPCAAACFPEPSEKISQVTRLDYDGSDGQGKTLALVNPAAPIRIVGAGVSTCVNIQPL